MARQRQNNTHQRSRRVNAGAPRAHRQLTPPRDEMIAPATDGRPPNRWRRRWRRQSTRARRDSRATIRRSQPGSPRPTTADAVTNARRNATPGPTIRGEWYTLAVPSTRSSAGPLLGVGLVSASLLMTELALTRIFSVIMYYHFAFLAISIALFGVSASGVFAYVLRRRLASSSTPALLAAASLVYALCTIVALFFLVRLRVGLNYSPENLRLMLTIYALAALPFFSGGLVVTLTISRLTDADQRDLRRRSPGRGSRLPVADSAARPPWRTRRGSERGGVGGLGRCSLRSGQRKMAHASPAARKHFCGRGCGPDLRARGFRRRRHEGPHRRPRAVQQVELVLPDWRVRARTWRLVAQPGLRRPAPGYAIHGHRLGRLNTHPSTQSPISPTPQYLRFELTALAVSPQSAGLPGARHRSGRRARPRVGAGFRRRLGGWRRNQSDYR